MCAVRQLVLGGHEPTLVSGFPEPNDTNKSAKPCRLHTWQVTIHTGSMLHCHLTLQKIKQDDSAGSGRHLCKLLYVPLKN